jgi:hypothetical protein
MCAEEKTREKTIEYTDPSDAFAHTCSTIILVPVHRRAGLPSNMQVVVDIASGCIFYELFPGNLVLQGKKDIDQLHIVRPLHEQDLTSAPAQGSDCSIAENDF